MQYGIWRKEINVVNRYLYKSAGSRGNGLGETFEGIGMMPIDSYPLYDIGDMKGLGFIYFVTIDESFRDLFKNHNYEKYIGKIINRSKKIFRDKAFSLNDDQAHGESDFVDSAGQKYELKLLFDESLGQQIGDKRNDVEDWLNTMLAEQSELSLFYGKSGDPRLEQTRLYRIAESRLMSIRRDEHAILFIPFPIVDFEEGAVHLQFARDYLQAIYELLDTKGIVGDRELFFIYPHAKPNMFVLRDSRHRCELISCPELGKYIQYSCPIILC